MALAGDVEAGTGYQNLAAPDASRSKELRQQYTSHWGVPSHERLAGIHDATLRAGFIRKVYGILAAQMAFTVLVALVSMTNESIQMTFVKLAMSGSAVQLAMYMPTLACICCLMVAKNSYPTNYILLSVFTLCMAVNVGFVCAVFAASGLGILVFQAFAITMAIFLVLSGYAMYSGKDFSYLGGFLCSALTGLIIVGFLGFFIPSLVHNVIYPLLGALIFSGYILYDTWRIETTFGYDDYILAAIELYLDLVNLFLYILQLLASDNR